MSPSNMRLSDAERSEVADRLSRHFGDGRLDQAELDERLDRVMNAKTHGDLTGLFDDLPGEGMPVPPQPSPPPFTRRTSAPVNCRRRRHPILTVALVVLIAIVVGHAATHMFFFTPWLLIAFLAFLWIRHHEHDRRHRSGRL